MSKILVSILNEKMIDKLEKNVDAYLIGVEGFSVNMPYYVKENNLKCVIEKIKSLKKEIFINLNKNMFKSDLPKLKQLLLTLEEYQVDGICFYDVSLMSFKKNLNLKTPFVWHQEHFTTNYMTINYWQEYGVKYTFLSNEITKEEIEEIKAKTTSILIAQVFGYVPIFLSKRPLITNYKKYFHLEDNSKTYYMEKEQKEYPILERNGVLEVYDSEVLNAHELDVDYIYLNSFKIEEEKFLKITEAYKNKNYEAVDEIYPKYDGFLSKKTVYRVRDL
jgi:putative protease